jgi:hypothetical protein
MSIIPQSVSDVEIAFATDVSKLLPVWEDIPEEFKRSLGTRWNKVFSDWFFHGLKDAKWQPKPGVDVDMALRHLKACMGSFEPKHEHKEAGCAYLMSQWFDDVSYAIAEVNP